MQGCRSPDPVTRAEPFGSEPCPTRPPTNAPRWPRPHGNLGFRSTAFRWRAKFEAERRLSPSYRNSARSPAGLARPRPSSASKSAEGGAIRAPSFATGLRLRPAGRAARLAGKIAPRRGRGVFAGAVARAGAVGRRNDRLPPIIDDLSPSALGRAGGSPPSRMAHRSFDPCAKDRICAMISQPPICR